MTLSCLNQTVHLHRLCRNLHFSHDASSDIVLSIKRMTKALIRLRGCIDWTVPLLFAYITIRSLRDETYTAAVKSVVYYVFSTQKYQINRDNKNLFLVSPFGLLMTKCPCHKKICLWGFRQVSHLSYRDYMYLEH